MSTNNHPYTTPTSQSTTKHQPSVIELQSPTICLQSPVICMVFLQCPHRVPTVSLQVRHQLSDINCQTSTFGHPHGVPTMSLLVRHQLTDINFQSSLCCPYIPTMSLQVRQTVRHQLPVIPMVSLQCPYKSDINCQTTSFSY